jgi:hypothetical protein
MQGNAVNDRRVMVSLMIYRMWGNVGGYKMRGPIYSADGGVEFRKSIPQKGIRTVVERSLHSLGHCPEGRHSKPRFREVSAKVFALGEGLRVTYKIRGRTAERKEGSRVGSLILLVTQPVTVSS